MSENKQVLLGWCIAKQHDICPTTVPLSDRNETAECNCSCHKNGNNE